MRDIGLQRPPETTSRPSGWVPEPVGVQKEAGDRRPRLPAAPFRTAADLRVPEALDVPEVNRSVGSGGVRALASGRTEGTADVGLHSHFFFSLFFHTVCERHPSD